MTRLDLLRRLHTQRAWANHRVIEVLARHPQERATGLFAHVLCSERAWLLRLTHRSTEGIQLWPVMTVEQCATLMRGNNDGFMSYLMHLHEDDLDRTITYRNFQGVEFTTPIADMLTHVSTHGVYHRGQIMLVLRSAGVEPIDTDFIIYQREGH